MKKKNKLTMILVVFAAMAALVTAGLGYALEPLLVAFALAYLFFSLIKKLENAGVNRVIAVSFVFVILVAGIILFFMAFVPWLVTETGNFLKELPKNFEKAVIMADNFAAKAGIDLNLSERGMAEMIKQKASTLSTDAVGKITGTMSGVFTNIFKGLTAVLNILLVPLFFFFMINDYEKIKKEIKSYVPEKYLPVAAHYMGRVNRVLNGYIRGKLLVALILGLLYGAGLHFIGLKYGFMIGLIGGILSIVPYVGSFIGFVAALIMGLAYYQGIWVLVGIGAVFMAAQVLETYVITPYLVGGTVGLSAFVTILAIIIGGNLWGVMGIFIAIPVAAIFKEILADLRKQYQDILRPAKKRKAAGGK